MQVAVPAQHRLQRGLVPGRNVRGGRRIERVEAPQQLRVQLSELIAFRPAQGGEVRNLAVGASRISLLFRREGEITAFSVLSREGDVRVVMEE